VTNNRKELRFSISGRKTFSQLQQGDMITTEFEKNAIAQQFLTALRNRDWELMRSIMTNDIVWSLPGTSLISGEADGVDAVIKRAQRIVSYGLNFGFKHVLFGQHGVALSLNNTAQRGDLILNEHLATVCSLRNGKISRIDTYLSDVEMVNAFFV
jgi:ketosteroid isomerase-like protein